MVVFWITGDTFTVLIVVVLIDLFVGFVAGADLGVVVDLIIVLTVTASFSIHDFGVCVGSDILIGPSLSSTYVMMK